MKETGLWAESIYIGGGTPTTLTAEQLDELLAAAEENIDTGRAIEFTIEAGRPDTITEEKLEVINSEQGLRQRILIHSVPLQEQLKQKETDRLNLLKQDSLLFRKQDVGMMIKNIHMQCVQKKMHRITDIFRILTLCLFT